MSSITKKQLKKYFVKYSRYDVTIEQLVKDFNIPRADIPRLQRLLDELENEMVILKAFCSEHSVFEYDPNK